MWWLLWFALPFCIVIILASIKTLCLKPLALIESDSITEDFAELISFDVSCFCPIYVMNNWPVKHNTKVFIKSSNSFSSVKSSVYTENPKSQSPVLKFCDSVICGFSLSQCSVINMLVFCIKTCFVFTYGDILWGHNTSVHSVHVIFQLGSILATNFSLKQNRTGKPAGLKKKSIFFPHKINRMKVEQSLTELTGVYPTFSIVI